MAKNFKDVKVGDLGRDILGLTGSVIAKGKLGWLMDVDAIATRIEGNTEDIDADAVAVEMLDSGEVYICVYGPDGFLVADDLFESIKIKKFPYREQNLNELKRIIESKEDELGGFKLGKINDVLNGLTYDYNDVYENDDGHLVIVIEDPECGSVDVCTDVSVEIKALMDSRVIICAYIDDYQDTAYVENVFPTFTSDGVNTTIEDFIKEYEEKTQSGSLNESKKFKERIQDEKFFEETINTLETIDFCYKDIYQSTPDKITVELDDIDDIDDVSGIILEIIRRNHDSYVLSCHINNDERDLEINNIVLKVTPKEINEVIYEFLEEYEHKEKLKESKKLQENVQSGDIFIIRGKGGDADYVNDVAKEMQSPVCMVDGKKAFKMTIEQVEELLGECDPGCFNMWECPSIQEESFDSDTLVRIHDIESAVWDRD